MIFLYVLLFATASALVLFFIARLLGYRQIAELTVFDYINSITIGSIAAELASSTSWEDAGRYGIAMVMYALFTYIVSLLDDKSPRFRRYLVGETAVLMRNGQLMDANFKRAKMDLNEFLMQCRIAGYFDLSELDTVFLEPNGRISLLPKAANRPTVAGDLGDPGEQDVATVAVVLDGEVQKPNLTGLGFDENWLGARLQAMGLTANRLFLATANRRGELYYSVRTQKP